MAVQREWFEKDYYQVLGVPENVSEKDLTRAYRKLAKQYHPDANPGAEDRFKEISTAYEVIGDPEKRKEYDEVRRMGPAAAGFGQPGGGFGGQTYGSQDMGDLGDLFGGLFGGRGRARRAAQRGDDLEAHLHLDFAEAIDGVTTSVHVPGQSPCSPCRGTGAKAGTALKTCQRCHGSGQMNDNQGMFSLAQVCPTCSGRGSLIEIPCDACHGSGRAPSNRQVKVRIPSGVDDGQRIKVKGKGSPGSNGGPAGDLYVVIAVSSHPLFTKKGRNLLISVPVSMAEAVLGTTVTVPSLHESVTVKVPAGFQSGMSLRVRGYGVPAAKVDGVSGDLLVKVDVTVPKHPTEEQLALFEQLRALDDDQALRSKLQTK